MGTLHFSLPEPAKWYFETLDYGERYRDRPRVESSFPYQCSIHITEFADNNNSLRVEIRRFINRRLEGDVIVREIGMSYRYARYHIDSRGNRRRYIGEVPHGYARFQFEEETDQVAFVLRFADIVSEESDRNPRHASVTEDQIEDARNNPFSY